MTYRAGDLVICHDADESGFLVKGRVYRVRASLKIGCFDFIAIDGNRQPFLASRFRPISPSQHETVRRLMAGARIGASLPEFRDVKEG